MDCPVPVTSYWWGVEQSTSFAPVASDPPCSVPLTISEMQLPALRSWMLTVLAPSSALALEPVEVSARGVAEGVASEP